MPRRSEASVRSRRLAITLRKLRRATGMTGADVAKAVEMSASKISRVESAESGIYLDDVEKLLDFYGVTKKQRVYLLDLARHAEQRGLLRVNNAHFPEDWQTWADFEDEASALLNYKPLTIPGLLQTTEYARQIIWATGHGLDEDQIETLVSSRMARQGLLTRSNPLQLHAIIEQAVFDRPFGDPHVYSRQIRHIVDMSEMPNITVQVMPTEAGLHPGLNGAFVILKYDDDPSLVLLENKIASHFLDEPNQIELFEDTWGVLRDVAFSVEETAAYLKGLT
ncbi:helix-turn-helix domain-containing protein [Saccharothrix deserti]|uniref:helix-turn-helix domain-containing protein n=1 Tax=Saccharothrix deserti TaxID=2593674 RepID=UPI00131CC9C6|nr:helix-turn-helix transcriptional regulator [Saccharothrix deserti]